MRKKLLPFITIAIMLLFGACSNEELLPEVKAETNVEETRTLSLTATMPGEDKPTTRVALSEDQDGLSINLEWETTDVLQLAFVKEGQNTVNQTVNVRDIVGKKAEFDINLPTGFETGEFDLYGVYGKDDILDGTDITLPENAGAATSLNGGDASSVQNRKDVILYFESKNIDPNNLNISVEFKHLGSIFAVTIMNTTAQDLYDATEIRLACDDTEAQWAYNTEAGGQKYNLADREFLNPATGSGYYISFNPQGINFPSEGSATLWAWYPPLPDIDWPELWLQIKPEESDWIESQNTKPARTAPTSPGKAYHFYAVWNGTNLNFTNDQFEVPLVPEP